jgi:hypothetical protein
MTSDEIKKQLDLVWRDYVSLGNDAATIVRRMKKSNSIELRSRLSQELRSLDRKRLELVDGMDELFKSLRALRPGR